MRARPCCSAPQRRPWVHQEAFPPWEETLVLSEGGFLWLPRPFRPRRDAMPAERRLPESGPGSGRVSPRSCGFSATSRAARRCAIGGRAPDGAVGRRARKARPQARRDRVLRAFATTCTSDRHRLSRRSRPCYKERSEAAIGGAVACDPPPAARSGQPHRRRRGGGAAGLGDQGAGRERARCRGCAHHGRACRGRPLPDRGHGRRRRHDAAGDRARGRAACDLQAAGRRSGADHEPRLSRRGAGSARRRRPHAHHLAPAGPGERVRARGRRGRHRPGRAGAGRQRYPRRGLGPVLRDPCPAQVPEVRSRREPGGARGGRAPRDRPSRGRVRSAARRQARAGAGAVRQRSPGADREPAARDHGPRVRRERPARRCRARRHPSVRLRRAADPRAHHPALPALARQPPAGAGSPAAGRPAGRLWRSSVPGPPADGGAVRAAGARAGRRQRPPDQGRGALSRAGRGARPRDRHAQGVRWPRPAGAPRPASAARRSAPFAPGRAPATACPPASPRRRRATRRRMRTRAGSRSARRARGTSRCPTTASGATRSAPRAPSCTTATSSPRRRTGCCWSTSMRRTSAWSTSA